MAPPPLPPPRLPAPAQPVITPRPPAIGAIFNSGAILGQMKKTGPVDFKNESEDAATLNLHTMNPTKIQRTLDALRKHRVTPQETALLMVPTDLGDRVDVHTPGGIVVLCGGCKSVRFTGMQIKYILATTRVLRDMFCLLEEAFAALTTAEKRGSSNGNDTQTTDAVADYVTIADTWRNTYVAFATFIVRKQSTVIAEPVGPPRKADEKTGSRYPKWLTCMMLIYSARKPEECARAEQICGVPIDSLTKFSLFLAGLWGGEDFDITDYSCTHFSLQEIQDYIEELTHASGCYVPEEQGHPMTLRARATRIRAFLKTLSELKGVMDTNSKI